MRLMGANRAEKKSALGGYCEAVTITEGASSAKHVSASLRVLGTSVIIFNRRHQHML